LEISEISATFLLFSWASPPAIFSRVPATWASPSAIFSRVLASPFGPEKPFCAENPFYLEKLVCGVTVTSVLETFSRSCEYRVVVETAAG